MIPDTQYLQSAATADGNGSVVSTGGYLAAQQVEVVNAGTGSCTVTLEGAFDSGSTANWYAIGYYQIDGQTSLSRSVSGLSLSGASHHVYQLLDPYPLIRARISSTSGTTGVSVRLYRVG